MFWRLQQKAVNNLHDLAVLGERVLHPPPPPPLPPPDLLTPAPNRNKTRHPRNRINKSLNVEFSDSAVSAMRKSSTILRKNFIAKNYAMAYKTFGRRGDFSQYLISFTGKCQEFLYNIVSYMRFFSVHFPSIFITKYFHFFKFSFSCFLVINKEHSIFQWQFF